MRQKLSIFPTVHVCIFLQFFRNSHQQSGGDYTEGTGYMYRASATPDYPTAPPYNPDFPPHQNPYADHLHYPTGVIPPHSEQRQPLIQPPAYHDVVQGR